MAKLIITIGPDGYVWIWNITLERLQLILPTVRGIMAMRLPVSSHAE